MPSPTQRGRYTRKDVRVVKHHRYHRYWLACGDMVYDTDSGKWDHRSDLAATWFWYKTEALAVAKVCPLPKGKT